MSRHYIGFDVHKKSISFCIKTADGTIVEEGEVAANRAPSRPPLGGGASLGQLHSLAGNRHLLAAQNS